jgi:DNA polymerase-1
MSDDSTLYLVDGSSYIYRAYYAIRHLSSPSGHPTNAIYGFIQMLLKLLKDHQPHHVAVVFDVGRVTFRTGLYPDYKANRAAMPDDLRAQVGPIRDVVRAFNIPVLELAGYEADDIIGALAARHSAAGGRVVVVTGDKDLMQIVSERVTLLDTMKGKASGIAEVIERFGVGPERVPDILGLAGDSSDNIPGVPGIGEKTAIKLIQEFGSLDQLLERTGEVKGKVGEKLREFREQALLSRTLATIELNVPLEVTAEELSASEPDTPALNSFFKKYGFTTLIKEMTATATLATDNYRTVTTVEGLAALAAELERSGEFAFDLETTSLDPRLAEIVGLSFSFRDHEACYIPVGHVAPRLASEGSLYAQEASMVSNQTPATLMPWMASTCMSNLMFCPTLRRAGFSSSGRRRSSTVAGGSWPARGSLLVSSAKSEPSLAGRVATCPTGM